MELSNAQILAHLERKRSKLTLELEQVYTAIKAYQDIEYNKSVGRTADDTKGRSSDGSEDNLSKSFWCKFPVQLDLNLRNSERALTVLLTGNSVDGQ